MDVVRTGFGAFFRCSNTPFTFHHYRSWIKQKGGGQGTVLVYWVPHFYAWLVLEHSRAYPLQQAAALGCTAWHHSLTELVARVGPCITLQFKCAHDKTLLLARLSCTIKFISVRTLQWFLTSIVTLEGFALLCGAQE